jgi:serine/threonine protein kinase
MKGCWESAPLTNLLIHTHSHTHVETIALSPPSTPHLTPQTHTHTHAQPTNPPPFQVAVKMYHKDRMSGMNVRQVAREIEIHASLLHPHIIRLYAAFEDGDGIYLVQEYAAQGVLGMYAMGG